MVVGLLEITENPSLRIRRNANSSVTDHEADFGVSDAGRDGQRNAAGRRKFDCVACKIEQHLAQARGVSDHFGWQGLIDIGGDFKLPGLRTRRQQFGDVLDQIGQDERAAFQVDHPGLDLGIVE